jgi:hypothetical protein
MGSKIELKVELLYFSNLLYSVLDRIEMYEKNRK